MADGAGGNFRTRIPPEPAPRTNPGRSRPLRAALGLLLLLFLIVPCADVVWTRFVPPAATWLAVQRTFEGKPFVRRWRPLGRISPDLVYAVLASEDNGFCVHHGFDWKGIQAAFRYNAHHRTRIHGGSTISQQTAKNVFLWPGRDYLRKGLEAYYTVLIEAIWGKRRIMEVYLNQIEWAPGVYGAQAASEYWYHTDASALAPAQAAHLAAILPRPLKWRASDSGPYVRGRTARIGPAMTVLRARDAARCVLQR